MPDNILHKIPHIEDLRAAIGSTGISAWLVGGVVRDLLLGRAPLDVDLATDQPEALARRFAEITGWHLVPLDPEHGVWRVAEGTDACVDFCLLRAPDIVGDLLGRDFTINAMALAVSAHEAPVGLLDPFHGRDDLEHGILRMAGPRAFADDPARVLRAFRFVAELNLEIEADTWTALLAETPRLPAIASERILLEWWKLCAGAHAARAMGEMDSAGALAALFPELAAEKGVTQNVYHRFDVWEHSLLAMATMTRAVHHPDEIFGDLKEEFAPLLVDAHRRARLVCLALLHDMGKPATRSESEGRIHFYRHEVAGAEMAAQLALRLRMSREDQRALHAVILHHLRPLFLLQSRRKGELSLKAKLRFFNRVDPYALEVLALALADKTAGKGPASEPDIMVQLHALYRELFTFYRERYLPAFTHPLLTGADLIRELHLSPGPRIGVLLQQIRMQQILGTLTTREQALAWASSRH